MPGPNLHRTAFKSGVRWYSLWSPDGKYAGYERHVVSAVSDGSATVETFSWFRTETGTTEQVATLAFGTGGARLEAVRCTRDGQMAFQLRRNGDLFSGAWASQPFAKVLPPDFLPNFGNAEWVATLPQEAHSTWAFSRLPMGTETTTPATLECLGLEEVKVPAKTGPAWHFVERVAGKERNRYWVDAERNVLKIAFGLEARLEASEAAAKGPAAKPAVLKPALPRPPGQMMSPLRDPLPTNVPSVRTGEPPKRVAPAPGGGMPGMVAASRPPAAPPPGMVAAPRPSSTPKPGPPPPNVTPVKRPVAQPSPSAPLLPSYTPPPAQPSPSAPLLPAYTPPTAKAPTPAPPPPAAPAPAPPPPGIVDSPSQIGLKALSVSPLPPTPGSPGQSPTDSRQPAARVEHIFPALGKPPVPELADRGTYKKGRQWYSLWNGSTPVGWECHFINPTGEGALLEVQTKYLGQDNQWHESSAVVVFGAEDRVQNCHFMQDGIQTELGQPFFTLRHIETGFIGTWQGKPYKRALPDDFVPGFGLSQWVATLPQIPGSGRMIQRLAMAQTELVLSAIECHGEVEVDVRGVKSMLCKYVERVGDKARCVWWIGRDRIVKKHYFGLEAFLEVDEATAKAVGIPNTLPTM